VITYGAVAMKNLMAAIEAKLMPLAGRMAQQRHLGAIRDAYISFMPFIIVGSILLVILSTSILNKAKLL